MMTQEQRDQYERERQRERANEIIAGSCVCAECGGGLVTPWSPEENQVVLRCSQDKSHQGHVYVDSVLARYYRLRKSMSERGESTEEIDAEIQEYQIKEQIRRGAKKVQNGTALQEYKKKGLITEEAALEVIRTTPGWEKAPANVIKRAALVCRDYGLYPGYHIFLIPFKRRTGETEWAIVRGIESKRLQASRRKAYRQVDGPRIPTVEEAKSPFQDEYNPNLIYAITVLEGLDGSRAEAWGTWPKADTPYGVDKGNSKANMAEIRSEGKCLSRLCPGEFPPGIGDVDEAYLGAAPAPGIREVTLGTGEIIEGSVVAPPELELGQEPPAVKKAESQGRETPRAQDSRLMSKDPSLFTPKTQADLVGGAAYFWKLKLDDVTAELGGKLPSTPEMISEAWQHLLGLHIEGEENAS